MYFLLGICLTFALLLTLNVLASLAASVFWRIIKNSAQNLSAKNQSQLIFALRVIPLTVASVIVFAFLLPSYFLFEPAASDETISFKLGLTAIISAVGVLIALSRVFGTWWRTRQLIKNWSRRGELISINNIDFPIYRFRHPFPVIAVVGIVRPRIYIANQIFQLLEDEELAAAIVHEFGHLAAHDNFKRTFLRACRDLVVFPIGKSLERTWTETAEAAADEYALSTGGNRTAVNLAAALVKIARIIPENTSPAMPLGAFLIDEQTADVSWRVHRLIHLTETDCNLQRRTLNFSSLLYLGSALLLLPVLWLSTNYDFLSDVHKIMESLVRILQ